MRENCNTFSSAMGEEGQGSRDEGRRGEGEAAGEPRRTKLMRGEEHAGGRRWTPGTMAAGGGDRLIKGCAAKGSIVKTESLG